MEVSLEVRSRKQPESNHTKKSEEDDSRFFDRNVHCQGSHAGLEGHIKDSGFLSTSNEDLLNGIM